MGRHQAGPEERTTRGDGRVEGDVGVDAGLEQRLPQEDRLPVLADDHGYDRSGRLGTVWKPARVDDLQPEVREPAPQVGGVVEQLLEEGPTLRPADPNGLQ